MLGHAPPHTEVVRAQMEAVMRYLNLRTAAMAVLVVLSLAACSANASGASTSGTSTTVAKPFSALPEPQIQATLSVAEAQAFVETATMKTTDWKGPVDGPTAVKAKQTIAYVSADQSYVSYVNWGAGITEAAKVLGWDVTAYDGKGTVSGTLAAMQQALVSNPVAIITTADASALQAPIAQAVQQGIPVIGIHATAYPGPDPKLNLFDNISTDPAQIGLAQAAYVIADSDGKAKLVHMLDNSYAIARFKAKATESPIQNLSSATFLEEVNIPFADMTGRIPGAVSAMMGKYGSETLWVTSCCDGFYPYVAAALSSSGVKTSAVKLIGSDGSPAAYDMIRKGQYEVATVPEPSTLFGYQAVDSIVRAMAGQKPAVFSQPAYLVTATNIDAEGGDKNQYIPSNGFACHYTNIWLGKNDICTVG
jgi:ribose transport system substrate-binding protein